MSSGWHLERGANLHADARGARFELWAPAAATAEVVLETGAAIGHHRLERDELGTFAGVVPGVRAGDDYRYRLDGHPLLVPDPVSRHQPEGVHGPSRVVDPAAFAWTAPAPAYAMADLVIYELHVGTFTVEGTFDAAITRLGALAELGVTAVELMPVAEFPGARNWGYDGVGLYAPESSYGGPEGLRRFVDAAHRVGLAVVLDVVYNHVGPEGNYLGRFGPYFSDRYRTPWGSAVNFDGPGSDEVRRFVIDNARYWVTEFRVDALRLDAVHEIFDMSARHVLEELASEARTVAAAVGRKVLLIAESDLNDPKLVRPVDRGGYGLDAQWSDDFHHAVHAALTGERSGYYADFGSLEHLARAVGERFAYAGRRSPYRGRRHGSPATDVPADRFVVAIQNHDQVGNRAVGDRLGFLVDPPGQRLAAALLLLSPYVPLLFMGEEYADPAPFQYFVSHGDPELNAAVGAGRRREFEAFGWPGDVPDPAAVTTFERSRINWDLRDHGDHARLRALYAELLGIRRREAVLRPGLADVDVRFDASSGWLATRLTRADHPALLSVFGFGDGTGSPVTLPIEHPGAWNLVLTTEDERYGGAGSVRWDGNALTLPTRGAALFKEGGR